MKIGIHTWGSEGDVRPFLALADGLVDAGHEVRLAYCAAEGRDYSARLANARYEHRRLSSPSSPEELRRVGGEIFAEPNQLRQLSRVVQELLDPVVDEMTESAAELAKWADVLVLHFLAHPLSAAAEKERKPFVCVYTAPFIVTRAYPPGGRMASLGPLNAPLWRLSRVLFSAQLLGSVNRGRKGLGLEPRKRIWQQLDQSAIDLVVLSPTLFPRPSDWREKVHVSGFLSPPLGQQQAPLDAALLAFLAEGPAPVYITFGSMSATEREPRALAELIEQAVAATGCRAIVQAEVAGRSSPNVLWVTGTVAHAQVFPRCAAIVHHGGAGTTQASLRAGRPSVVVAHATDQFMWGRQLHKLGVAPPCLTRRGLTPKQLTRAIESAVRDTTMQATAERLGRKMRDEDGLKRAVELIALQRPGRALHEGS